jgi:hypothetical protein
MAVAAQRVDAADMDGLAERPGPADTRLRARSQLPGGRAANEQPVEVARKRQRLLPVLGDERDGPAGEAVKPRAIVGECRPGVANDVGYGDK